MRNVGCPSDILQTEILATLLANRETPSVCFTRIDRANGDPRTGTKLPRRHNSPALLPAPDDLPVEKVAHLRLAPRQCILDASRGDCWRWPSCVRASERVSVKSSANRCREGQQQRGWRATKEILSTWQTQVCVRAFAPSHARQHSLGVTPTITMFDRSWPLRTKESRDMERVRLVNLRLCRAVHAPDV